MVARNTPTPPPAPTKAANRHVRRVTLNIIRLAACCPDDLRPTLNKLADEYDWNFDRLSRAEQEQIYSVVDEELGDTARSEFHADLQSIKDHRDCSAQCQLCGHQHIRFEFDLINTEGGTSTRTGSTCIETYGLSVDGESTSEAALKALRRAIASARRKADREDWQEDHPDHEEQIERLRRVYNKLRHNQKPYGLYQHLEPRWNRRVKARVATARAILKYYDREGFLTDLRTGQLYGTDDTPSLTKKAEAMSKELEAAREAQRTNVERWNRFLRECKMDRWQRRRLEYLRDRGVSPDDLRPKNKRLVMKIWRANGKPKFK